MIRNFLRVVVLAFLAGLMMAPLGASAGPVQDGQNGSFCSRNGHCISGYCADGQKCSPRDGTGQPGAYCHHNNHCSSGFCRCNKGSFGFCRNWEDWPAGTFDASSAQSRYIQIGFCN